MNVDASTQVVVIGMLLIGNAAAIVGGWVSMRVMVAEIKVRLELEVANLKEDVNNLGSLYRSFKTKKESENE